MPMSAMKTRLQLAECSSPYTQRRILRGKKGITTFETSLRDFFTKGPNAPIIVSDYERVTDELAHVLDVLQIIDGDTEKNLI